MSLVDDLRAARALIDTPEKLSTKSPTPAALSPRTPPMQNKGMRANIEELVIAARIVAFEDQSAEALKRLDTASEQFATLVPWDDAPADRATRPDAAGIAGWQSMDSAPRDGSYILAFPVLLSTPCVIVWERSVSTPPMMRAKGENIDHDGYWRIPMTGKPAPYTPTHWMPLPAAPAIKADTVGEP